MLYHYHIQDSVRPIIHSLIAYPFSDDAIVNSSKQEMQIPFKKINDSIYTADPIVAIGKIGFGIGTYDRHDNTLNKNGVYSITAKLNGTQVKKIQFSKIQFSDSQYLNTLIDYQRYSLTRQRIQKLFRSPGNELGFFEHLEDGLIDVEIGKDYAYQIKVSDANNNNCYLFLPIKEKNKKLPYYPKKSLKEKRLSQIEIISSYMMVQKFISLKMQSMKKISLCLVLIKTSCESKQIMSLCEKLLK